MHKTSITPPPPPPPQKKKKKKKKKEKKKQNIINKNNENSNKNNINDHTVSIRYCIKYAFLSMIVHLDVLFVHVLVRPTW